MDNALQLIGQFPENREQIKSFVHSFCTSAMNGYNEPLEILKKIKVLEEITKQVKSELSDFFQDEACLHIENTIEKFGCKFTKQERPTYDFSICEDSEWDMMQAQLVKLKKEIKDRETLLKCLKTEIVNIDTGEIIKLPAKTSKSIIAVTLSK